MNASSAASISHLRETTSFASKSSTASSVCSFAVPKVSGRPVKHLERAEDAVLHSFVLPLAERNWTATGRAHASSLYRLAEAVLTREGEPTAGEPVRRSRER